MYQDLSRAFYALFARNCAPAATIALFFLFAPASANELAQQRIHYEMAKSALNSGDWSGFRLHQQQLGDYPLALYLEYGRLKSKLSSADQNEIDDFLNREQSSFLSTRLREQWLYHLAVNKRWAEFLNYYQPDASTTEMRCLWLQARLFERDSSALTEVGDLWVGGKSHPKTCDPLFNRWRRSGGLSQELVWQRFNNALDAGNRSLANYVSRMMDEHHRSYADLYSKVVAYPSTIRKRERFSEHSPLMQEVIVAGIKAYARQNPKAALKLWEGYEAQQLFPERLSTDAKLAIATQLLRKRNTQQAEALVLGSRDLQQPKVVESLIRDALRAEDWPRVKQWLALLSPELRNSDRWRYWQARALGETASDSKDAAAASLIYQSLSESRSFYGFLAADHLGRRYELQNVPVTASPELLAAIGSMPGMRRAKELWLTDNLGEAHAEWLFTTRGLDNDELVAAGELARQWGWYNKGINAMITGNLWDHLSIRFPLAYEDQIQQVSSQTNVEPAFIYAIARQESAFAEQAKSSAGAMGLMQLMPTTAKETAQRNGIKHKQTDLYNPVHNMELGSLYLNQLLQQYQGNRVHAAAAYNAGPHRVDRWLKAYRADLPTDIWIEVIPFRETRGYVQNVLAFSVIYGLRLGKPNSLINENEVNSLL